MTSSIHLPTTGRQRKRGASLFATVFCDDLSDAFGLDVLKTMRRNIGKRVTFRVTIEEVKA